MRSRFNCTTETKDVRCWWELREIQQKFEIFLSGCSYTVYIYIYLHRRPQLVSEKPGGKRHQHRVDVRLVSVCKGNPAVLEETSASALTLNKPMTSQKPLRRFLKVFMRRGAKQEVTYPILGTICLETVHKGWTTVSWSQCRINLDSLTSRGRLLYK